MLLNTCFTTAGIAFPTADVVDPLKVRRQYRLSLKGGHGNFIRYAFMP
ncbi:hypothetical protein KCP78_05150 [Salmonella enterica subsp. enterica]|nr:hypothetical protein KCP78_05150 [Salmonella enterica subsp. enterica]